MSYAAFCLAVSRAGRSSRYLPRRSEHRRFRGSIYLRNNTVRERTWFWSSPVKIINPQAHPRGTAHDHYPLNWHTLNRIFGRLDDIHDLAPERVKVRTAAIYRRWCIKMWGTHRMSGRYQLRWPLSNWI